MKPNEYQCAWCDEVFEKGRSDEEAMEETQKHFGNIPQEDCAVICDDCYQRECLGGIKMSDTQDKDMEAFEKFHKPYEGYDSRTVGLAAWKAACAYKQAEIDHLNHRIDHVRSMNLMLEADVKTLRLFQTKENL